MNFTKYLQVLLGMYRNVSFPLLMFCKLDIDRSEKKTFIVRCHQSSDYVQRSRLYFLVILKVFQMLNEHPFGMPHEISLSAEIN